MPEILWWPNFIIGVVLCLFGWLLYWLGINLAGGILGAGIVGAIAYQIALHTVQEPNQSLYIGIGGAVLGAILGMFLVRKLHRLFFFLSGAFLGFLLGWMGLDWLNTGAADWLAARDLNLQGVGYHVLAGMLVALIGGILMVRGSKWMIAALTSLFGATMAALAFPDPLWLLAVPPVALAAFFLQIGLLGKIGSGKTEKAEPE
jgi:hypothetical protein